MTLLGIASYSLHEPAVEILLAKGASVDQYDRVIPPLFSAITSGNLAIMRLLLQRGANIHRLDDHCTPLHEAASENDHKALELLLEFGADPNARDRSGRTALFTSATAGHCECIRVLLDAGADVNAHCIEGIPLMSACLWEKVDAVWMLIERGANVNYTSEESDLQWVNVLLEAGAQINAQNRDGKTPLYLAMERKDRESLMIVATLLLDGGADPTIKSNAGLTPLGLFPVDVTWSRQWEELLERFIEKGADLQAKTETGETVWQRLCEAGQKNPGLLHLLNKTSASAGPFT
ncbi:Ankyrin repeat and SOCS box protein 16 [Phlyctochytrium bullatum]|nr:Ankyrin repeat and SOCS box protein 16 [Phlyctochytrium bullatum]